MDCFMVELCKQLAEEYDHTQIEDLVWLDDGHEHPGDIQTYLSLFLGAGSANATFGLCDESLQPGIHWGGRMGQPFSILECGTILWCYCGSKRIRNKEGTRLVRRSFHKYGLSTGTRSTITWVCWSMKMPTTQLRFERLDERTPRVIEQLSSSREEDTSGQDTEGADGERCKRHRKSNV